MRNIPQTIGTGIAGIIICLCIFCLEMPENPYIPDNAGVFIYKDSDIDSSNQQGIIVLKDSIDVTLKLAAIYQEYIDNFRLTITPKSSNTPFKDTSFTKVSTLHLINPVSIPLTFHRNDIGEYQIRIITYIIQKGVYKENVREKLYTFRVKFSNDKDMEPPKVSIVSLEEKPVNKIIIPLTSTYTLKLKVSDELSPILYCKINDEDCKSKEKENGNPTIVTFTKRFEWENRTKDKCYRAVYRAADDAGNASAEDTVWIYFMKDPISDIPKIKILTPDITEQPPVIYESHYRIYGFVVWKTWIDSLYVKPFLNGQSKPNEIITVKAASNRFSYLANDKDRLKPNLKNDIRCELTKFENNTNVFLDSAACSFQLKSVTKLRVKNVRDTIDKTFLKDGMSFGKKSLPVSICVQPYGSTLVQKAFIDGVEASSAGVVDGEAFFRGVVQLDHTKRKHTFAAVSQDGVRDSITFILSTNTPPFVVKGLQKKGTAIINTLYHDSLIVKDLDRDTLRAVVYSENGQQLRVIGRQTLYPPDSVVHINWVPGFNELGVWSISCQISDGYETIISETSVVEVKSKELFFKTTKDDIKDTFFYYQQFTLILKNNKEVQTGFKAFVNGIETKELITLDTFRWKPTNSQKFGKYTISFVSEVEGRIDSLWDSIYLAPFLVSFLKDTSSVTKGTVGTVRLAITNYPSVPFPPGDTGWIDFKVDSGQSVNIVVNDVFQKTPGPGVFHLDFVGSASTEYLMSFEFPMSPKNQPGGKALVLLLGDSEKNESAKSFKAGNISKHTINIKDP
ncbi:MAG: hypothetical protein JW795_12105 [Chitinivibrionales bacterium]|nr:hypothetical protein [Chitinivibrionales bacterium]